MTPLSACVAVLEHIRSGYAEDLDAIVRKTLRARKVDIAAAPIDLLEATRRALHDFASVLEDPIDDARALSRVDDLLWLDEQFLAFLVIRYPGVGEEAAALARAKWRAATAVDDFDPWRAGTPKRVGLLAQVVWLAEVESRLLGAIAIQPVRIPTAVARSFAHARAHGGKIDGETIYVEPPKGLALTLPFGEERRVTRCARKSGAVVGLRQVLTPRALHTYIVTLLLYQEAGMRTNGSFEIEGPSSILDLMGARARRYRNTRDGRTLTRFDSKSTTGVRDDLLLFSLIRTRIVGDLEARSGDPLLDEIIDRRAGKTTSYAHSRLVVGELRQNYFRIPRAVCCLHTEDVPIAMGIAAVARGHMVRCLKAGGHAGAQATIEAPIYDWLTVAGIDVASQLRKEGPTSFWPRSFALLARVAEEGKIGTIAVHGAARDAVLSLTVDRELRESYAPLLAASKRQQRAKHAGLASQHRKPR